MISLREEKVKINEIGLEESGDYTIFIGSTNHKLISLTLTIKIAKSGNIFVNNLPDKLKEKEK